MVNNIKGEENLTVQEVASMFKVNPMTVYRMISDGRLKAFKFGNQWRIKKSIVKNLEKIRQGYK